MKKVREGYKMTELGEIPSDWEVKTIEDVCYLNPDTLSNKTKENFIIEYIDIESVTTGKVNGTKMFEFKNSPSRARRIIKKNDVIMSTVRPYLKAFTKINIDKENLVCSTGFAVLRAKDIVNHEFIFQTILSDYYIQQLSNKMVGSNYPAVNTSDIKESIIILPSKKEQEKIAIILSTVDEQIDNIDGLIQKNKELKKGLMQQLLTKGIGHTKFKKTEIGEIPEEWEVINLNECGYIFGGNAFKSSNFTTEYNIDDYQVIRMGNVQLGKLDLKKNPVFMPNNLVGEKEKKYLLNESDVIISLTGTVNKTDYGNISWVDKNNRYLLNQRVACLRNTNLLFNNRYYYYFLQSNIFRNQFFESGVGGTGNQANVSVNDLSNIKVFKLPIREQEKIVLILSEVDKKIEGYENKKQELEELKKGLMQQLLTGKIRV